MTARTTGSPSAPRVAFVVPDSWAADALFDPTSVQNRDDSFSGWRMVREGVEAMGGECHTHDVFLERGTVPDIVIFLDVPSSAAARLHGSWRGSRRWLVIQECDAIVPRNWRLRNHRPFERIFTWNDDWVDEVRYFKLNFSNPLTTRVVHRSVERPGFATMIAGNKKAFDRRELYRARRQVIRWYARNAPDAFDLYGMGWDTFVFGGPKIIRGLNYVPGLALRLPAFTPRSWRGPVATKLETLSRYRFTYCYENARDITGYLTEKLFDALMAGSIPIYWGDPDVQQRVPFDCWIDRRQFASTAEVHEHLRAISADDHRRIIDAADAFLGSEHAKPYSDRCYAATLLAHVRASHGASSGVAR